MTGDVERYRTFWSEFGATLKEGLIGDIENQAAILEVASFASTDDPVRQTMLHEYVARMKDGQEEIYYITGESRPMIEKSPHLEAFLAKGYEVLLLSDPIDEMWVDAVPEFEGKRLTSIARGEVDLSTEEERKTAEPEREQQRKDFAGLLSFLGTALEENVKEVRLSTRLTTSVACLVGDQHDMTPTLERLYRAMGRDVPQVKRILEINPTHPLVSALRAAHEQHPDDARLAETAELVYGMALLAEGGDLADPARFTRLVADRLTRTL
jgi:molecular chaperone HtpG